MSAPFAPGQELAPYRVTARNLATDSENKIHDDETARTYGFAGGLVPGITVYAYMTRPVAEAFGKAWLERGTISARFVKPCYDGRPVEVRSRVDDVGEGGVSLSLEVVDERGDVCAVGTAGLPTAVEPPDPDGYPEAPVPDDPPPASPDAFESRPVLGTVSHTFDGARAPEFLAAVDDDLAVYREERVAHPGYLIWDANRILMENVRLGPWIHVSSDTRHFSTVTGGETISTRARVASLFERKGHRFVELDVLSLAGGTRPVLQARHVAIYQPRPVG